MHTCDQEGCENPLGFMSRYSKKTGERLQRKSGPCPPCSSLLGKYGITSPMRDDMLAEQNYKCKICEKPILLGGVKNGSDTAVIDHCHDTNIIRGVLCTNCNQGLGQFKDNIKVLKNAIEYLEESYVTEWKDAS